MFDKGDNSMEDVNELRKLFLKRDAYTIYFVPYFLSDTGILVEFVNAPESVAKSPGFTVRIDELEKFGKDLNDATKKRHAKPVFTSDPRK